MAPAHIRTRWNLLSQEIQRHDRLYYQQNAPEISDEAYDSLRDQLLKLEEEFPELRTPLSPSQKIGASPEATFRKAVHLFPVYSLEKVINEEELTQFLKKVERFLMWSQEKSLAWVAEPKIDGLTVILRYQKGKLIRGATRGNGAQGEEITDNVLAIPSIPSSLTGKGWPELMEVRGEVYMHVQDFAQLNDLRLQEGEPPFLNPRNAAAGSLRQLDASITQKRPLWFTVHGASYETFDSPPSTYQEMIAQLHAWGLPTQPLAKVCTGPQDIQSYFQEIQPRRDSLPYQIDGVVYKIDDFSYQARLGHSARSPRYAFAYKFPATEGVSLVEDICVQVGRTGTLTPVAFLSPVHLGGVTITRASLHNADEIARKDIRIGDTVKLQRAGDVIPQITQVMLAQRPAHCPPFTFPKACPACHTPIIRPEGQVAFQCPGGMTCPAQGVWRLRHFVSRPAFDIEGLGKKHCAFLYEQGLVRQPAELFDLTTEDLEKLPGWGPQSAHNVLQAISRKRKIPLHRLIYALGIPQVGESLAKLLASHYETWEKWHGAMTQARDPSSEAFQNLLAIEGIGQSIAHDVTAFLFHHQNMLHPLLERIEVLPHEKPSAKGKFAGQSIVFTGTLSTLSRAEAKQQAESQGAHVLSTLSRTTHYLVAGDKAGQKMAQAQKWGIPVLTEEEWLRKLEE